MRVDFNKFVCPVCSGEFEALIDLSGTQFDQRLDLKPVGAISAPSLIPVCPECKFVIYDDTISEAEIAQCRSIVESEQYRQYVERASYYLLGRLYQQLGKDHLTIAHVFLKASWQEEDDVAKLKEDLELSLEYFGKYLNNAVGQDVPWQTAQVLKGELLRRLGNFSEAESHLKRLLELEPFNDNVLNKVVRFEIELCSMQDSSSHTVSEAKLLGAILD